jgi:hypothetical protein
MLLAISRAINAALLGDPTEPLCARAHRRRWRIACAVIDIAFAALGDPCHCRRVRRDHRRKAMPGTHKGGYKKGGGGRKK